MKAVKTVLGWIVPFMILGAGIALFLGMGTQPPPSRQERPADAAIAVRTVAAEDVREGLTIEADGVVVPLREVTLAAEVPGRIRLKADVCDEGRFVTAGTVLFEIDPRDYELDVERLGREANQADLAIEELDEEVKQNTRLVDLASQQVELSRREVARVEGLRAGRVVTESERDRAVREELTAANALATLEGQRRVLLKRRSKLEEAKLLTASLLDKAKLDLSRTQVIAPIDGMVVEDKAEQGSFVAKGTPLVTIEDTTAAEVRTNLEMDDIARIWGGREPGEGLDRDGFNAPVTVVFRIGDAVFEWPGTLSRQEGRGLDEKTRSLPCRVRVPDPTAVRAIDRYGAAMPQLPASAPRSLLRGMFVQVLVHVPVNDPLVSIPEEAQRPSGEVWLMREGRLVVLRPRAMQASGGRLVFDARASGFIPGDRVIISPIASPHDGMAVTEPGGSEKPSTLQARVPEPEDAT